MTQRTCSIERCTRRHLARGYCSPHYKRFMAYGDPLGGRPLLEHLDPGGQRTCTDCGKTKSLDEFAPDARNRHGRKYICKPCASKRSLEWARANRERVAANRRRALIRRTYGEAGLAAYARIQAGEGCDICGHRVLRMAIDHDHITGEVRGILCKDCNLILGWVRDDSLRLRAMATYLESPPGARAA
jgi:hypothetical protein